MPRGAYGSTWRAGCFRWLSREARSENGGCWLLWSNPPNAAIPAVGAAAEQPVVRDGQLTVGRRMAMTMSSDHRVVDGAMAAPVPGDRQADAREARDAASLVMFDLVIMVDWSAARGVTKKPRADRCWLAWGTPHKRSEPKCFSTRLQCERGIVELAAGCSGRALVGMDFPFGYSAAAGLPVARALCRTLAELVHDSEDGTSNRFEAAAELNRRLSLAGHCPPPFWGHPQGRRYDDLTPTKPACPLREYRLIESRLRGRSLNIQSAFKLFGAGSVGSQTITGLASVHRMLTDSSLGQRAVLWPFETRWSERINADSVVFAEIWPTLGDFRAPRFAHHPIKDARQVAAMVDWACCNPDALARSLRRPDGLSETEEQIAREQEGWIIGSPV